MKFNPRKFRISRKRKGRGKVHKKNRAWVTKKRKLQIDEGKEIVHSIIQKDKEKF